MNRQLVPATPCLPVTNCFFRHFWHIFFGSREAVPIALFISSLENYCAADLPPGVRAEEVDERAGYMPLKAYGYAVDEKTHRAVFRTHVNNITESFNVKGYCGVANSCISVYELQSCTKYLPRNASLVHCLFLIARQGGFKYILPQEVFVLKDSATGSGGEIREASGVCTYENVYSDFIVADYQICYSSSNFITLEVYENSISANDGLCRVFCSRYNCLYFGNMPCYVSSLLQQCILSSRSKSDIFLFDLVDCNNESDVYFSVANTLSYYGYCDIDNNILNVSAGYRKMRKYVIRYFDNMKHNSIVIFSNVPNKNVFDGLVGSIIVKSKMNIRHKVIIVSKYNMSGNESNSGILKFVENSAFEIDVTINLFNRFQGDKVNPATAERIKELSRGNIEVMKLIVSLPKTTLEKILNPDVSYGLSSSSPQILYFTILYSVNVFSVDEILLIRYIYELNHAYNCTFDTDILWHLVKDNLSNKSRTAFHESFDNLERHHIIKIVEDKSTSFEIKGSYRLNIDVNIKEITTGTTVDFNCLVIKYFTYYADMIRAFNTDIRDVCFSSEREINDNSRNDRNSLTQLVVKHRKNFVIFHFVLNILMVCEKYSKTLLNNKSSESYKEIDGIVNDIRNAVQIYNPFEYANSNKIVDALLKNREYDRILSMISGSLNYFCRLLLPVNMGINLMLYSLNPNNTSNCSVSAISENFFNFGCILLTKQRHLTEARKLFSFVIKQFEFESEREYADSKEGLLNYFLSCYFIKDSQTVDNDANYITDSKSYLTKFILNVTKYHRSSVGNINDITSLVTKRLLCGALKCFGDVTMVELINLIRTRNNKVNENFNKTRNSKESRAVYDEYYRGNDDNTLYFKETQQVLNIVLFDIENVTNMNGVINNFETKHKRKYYGYNYDASFGTSTDREKELLSKARQLYIQAIVGCKKIYGEDSLTAAEFTVHMLNKLSPYYKNVHNESICAYKEVIKVYERRNLHVSDRMSSAYASLADLYALSNNSDRTGHNRDSSSSTYMVRTYYNNALGILKNLHNVDDKVTILTMNKLAIFLFMIKEYNYLISFFEKEFINYRKRIANGSKKMKAVDYQISSMLCAIASVFFINNQYDKALLLYHESVIIYKIFDNTHLLQLAEVRALQALCQNKQNIVEDFDSKDELNNTNHPTYLSVINAISETIVQLDKREYGRNHYVTLLFQIQGRIHLSRNNFSGFQSVYDHVLQKYPESTILTTEICELKLEFGVYLCNYGHLYEGKVVLEHTVSNFRTLYGDESMKVFEAIFTIATAYYGLMLYDEALDFAEDAAMVAAMAEGKESIRIADCHNLIAMIFQDLEEYDEARVAYSEAIQIYAKHPYDASYNANVAKILHNLGTLYDDIDDIESSAYFYERSLNILKVIDMDSSLDGMTMIPLAITAIENLSIMLEDTDRSTFLSSMNENNDNREGTGKVSEISKIIGRLEDTVIKIARTRSNKGSRLKETAGTDTTIEKILENVSNSSHENQQDREEEEKKTSGCVIM